MAGTKTGRTNRAAVTDDAIVAAVVAANGTKTISEVADGLGMTDGALSGRMTKLRKAYVEARKAQPKLNLLPDFKDGRSNHAPGESLANRLILMLGTHEEYLEGLESEETDTDAE